VGNSGSGSGNAADSGPVTIASGNELIFGAGMTFGSFTGAGSGFTTRIITSPNSDVAEDRVVATAGTYRATASANAQWMMQVAAFKAASGVSDTIAPSIPAGLTASAVSSSQINLSWNASTDNVGVAGYKVFRNSSQVGTSNTTAFADTGLSPGTTYTYRVA